MVHDITIALTPILDVQALDASVIIPAPSVDVDPFRWMPFIILLTDNTMSSGHDSARTNERASAEIPSPYWHKPRTAATFDVISTDDALMPRTFLLYAIVPFDQTCGSSDRGRVLILIEEVAICLDGWSKESEQSYECCAEFHGFDLCED
jgi:hypothetical protein